MVVGRPFRGQAERSGELVNYDVLEVAFAQAVDERFEASKVMACL